MKVCLTVEGFDPNTKREEVIDTAVEALRSRFGGAFRWTAVTAGEGTRVPDGQPGIRDVDAPCEEYKPGQPAGECLSDGHYLCKGCYHYKEEE